MMGWKRQVSSMSRDEIMGAIKDDSWQSFRLSLKGLSTEQKLDRLDTYLFFNGTARVEVVRVDNYINALLRGGQLVRIGEEIKVQR